MSELSNPTVTVVMATHNRVDFLSDAIGALRQQTYDNFRVVVVDDGSTDATAATLQLLTAEDRRFEVISQPNSGPAAARNHGAGVTESDWLLFTDDDCIAEPTWIANLIQKARTTSADIVQGQTMPDRRVGASERPLFGRTLSIQTWSGRFQTCNLLVRHQLFDLCDGFREDFPNAAGEDTDLGLRLVGHGAKTSFCADAVVDHRWLAMSYWQFLRRRAFWAEAVRLVSLNPSARSIFPHRYVAFRMHLVFWISLFVGIPLVVVGFWPIVPIGLAGWIVLQMRRTRDSKLPLRRRLLRAVGALPALAVSSASFVVMSCRYRTLLL